MRKVKQVILDFKMASVKLTIIFTMSFLTVFLIYCYHRTLTSKRNVRHAFGKKLTLKNNFAVDTPGCQIPSIDPFHPEVLPLYRRRSKKVCARSNVFATSNRTHLLLDFDLLEKKYGDFRCDYKRIWRSEIETKDNYIDNLYSTDGRYSQLQRLTRVNAEFVTVACSNLTDITYRDFFAFIQTKPEVELKREEGFKKWVTGSEGKVVERLSVTMVGIDSVSRLNMLRQMPKTVKFLRKLNAIDLQGFTKVADNTLVNVVPMLTGKFLDECWNESLVEDPFDSLNLVWKDFATRGYRTLFAEDLPKVATFNYRKAGFFEQPTDYYLRPFTLAFLHKMSKKDVKKGCYNDRLEVDVVLKWVNDFLTIFKKKPTFSFTFNTHLTHQYLNDASYADEPYYKFLNSIYTSNLMTNNVLIFFSDHGIRFGPIRQTYVGKIEERMPFYFLVFPPWFPKKYPKIWKNLKTNENRLTTPFDVYETLQEILNFTGKVKKAELSDRGISLFAQIPEERTCETAAILPHWCTCHARKIVSVEDVNVKMAADRLVNFINTKLRNETKCAVLVLDKIIDARVYSLSDEILRFKDSLHDVINRTVLYGERVGGIRNYLVTVSVKPSGALFEGTVHYFESSSKYVVNDAISRINEYGDQSSCARNAGLRLFCYCT